MPPDIFKPPRHLNPLRPPEPTTAEWLTAEISASASGLKPWLAHCDAPDYRGLRGAMLAALVHSRMGTEPAVK